MLGSYNSLFSPTSFYLILYLSPLLLSWCTIKEWHWIRQAIIFIASISQGKFASWLDIRNDVKGTCLCSKLQNALLFWVWSMLKINIFLESGTSHRQYIKNTLFKFYCVQRALINKLFILLEYYTLKLWSYYLRWCYVI